MISKESRMSIKNDVHIEGIKVGDKGTVIDFFPGEIYPIQMKMDKPDNDGHNIYRFKNSDVAILDSVEEKTVFDPFADWLNVKPTDSMFNIPL